MARFALTAARCGARIIEDDPYWLLAGDPPAPLARFAPAHVYYVSTLSKCLTPRLRIAYVLPSSPHRRGPMLSVTSRCLWAPAFAGAT